MVNKKIFIFLFDGFSDWEIAYLSPKLKKNKVFDLVYFSQYGQSVSSMGGLHVTPDMALHDINLDEVEMLILPGGTAWERDENDFMDSTVQNLFNTGKTIAAICAASIYLGKKGFLNKLRHTSNDLTYLKEMAPKYFGEQHYVNALAVTDQKLITANGIAPIEFAREIFQKLNLYGDEDIEKWYQLFKYGIWKE